MGVCIMTFKTFNKQTEVPLFRHEEIQNKLNAANWTISELKTAVLEREEKIARLQNIIKEQNERIEQIATH